MNDLIIRIRMLFKKIHFIITVCLLVMLLSTCTKDNPPDPPANPYAGVNYNTDTITPPTAPDPNSIVGLHKNIFFPKCAKSGCHDGTFEPDYRTVQSTYTTLVYQTCLKKNVLGDTVNFRLRAWPFKPDSSFLMKRLETTGSDYMPSNGTRLATSEIDHIRTWIQNGCPDQNGVIPSAPDLPPYVINYGGGIPAFAAYQNYPIGRLDSIRQNSYSSFIVPKGMSFYLYFALADDITPVPNLTNSQLKLSLNQDDFSAAVTLSPFYYGAYFWAVQVTNPYPSGTTVYFRYYVNDGHQPSSSEYPTNQSYSYVKTYCSFYVQ